MNLSKFSINRPISAVVLTFTLLFFGIVSIFRMKLSLFPEIDYPAVTVLVSFPNNTPQEVEKLIITPLEEVLSSIDGLKKIKSTSQDGLGIVVLYFDWRISREKIYMEVREKLDSAKTIFPREAGRPVVIQYDPSSQPIMQIGLTIFDSKIIDNSRYIIRKNLVPLLEQVKGVGKVEVIGGKEKEIKIKLSTSKFYSRNISLRNVLSSIEQNNLDYPVGYMKEGKNETLIKVKGKLKDYKNFENIVVGYGEKGEIVKLSDISEIFLGNKEETTKFIMNTNETLLLNVYLEGGENIVETCNKLKEEIKSLNKNFSEKYRLDILNSEDEEIKSSIFNIILSALIGMILASLVLFLFLGNFYHSFVVSLIIPLSVIGSFVFMYIFKISFNMISLMGLALVIGMLVDSNIVVVENINRTLENNSFNFDSLLYRGVKEVEGSVFNSILTNVAVFFPLIFATGIAGVLFKELAIVVTIALFISLFISLSFTPSFLKITSNFFKTQFNKENKFLIWLTKFYEKILLNILSDLKRLKIFIVILGVISIISLLTVVIFSEKEIFPKISRKKIVVEYKLPSTTSLIQNAEYAYPIINRLMKDFKNKIENIYAIIGEKSFYEFTTTERQNNKSKIWIIFRDVVSIKQKEKITYLINNFLPAGSEFVVYEEPISLETLIPQSSRFNSVIFSSDNREILKEINQKFTAFLENSLSVPFVRSSSEERFFYLIEPNRFFLSSFGASAYQMASLLNNFIAGYKAGVFYAGDEEIDIMVSGKEGEINNFDEILKIPIEVGEKKVPAGIFVNITNLKLPDKLYRVDQKPMEYVEFILSSKKMLKYIEKWIENILSNNDIRTEYSWNNDEIKNSITNLLFLLLLSIIIIYLIIVFQFESFIDPLIILFSILFVFPGFFVVVFLFNVSLNISSALGLILLSGVVVNNGIVLIEFFKQEINTFISRDIFMRNIVEASKKRLRPILMTSFTTIFSIVPLTIGSGEGFDFQKPLSLTITFGMFFSTIVTLVVIPVLYYLFNIKRISSNG